MLPRFLRRFAFPLVSLLPPLAGCSELVALGSECPAGDKVCSRPLGDGGVSVPDINQASASRDAGRVTISDGAVRDARVPHGSDGAGPSTPTALARFDVGNGAFSLSSGSPGDVTAVSLPTATGIQPWFTCQPIGGGPNVTTAVRAENAVTLRNGETAPGELVVAPNVVVPVDAAEIADITDTFVSIQHLVTLVDFPLLQRLPEPLVQSQRYAVAIDVRTGNAEALLSLQLRGGNVGDSCVGATGQTTLAETDPITRTGWHTVCLPFTAPVEYTHLVLSVKSNLLTDARLFLDNLRNATSKDCPAL